MRLKKERTFNTHNSSVVGALILSSERFGSTSVLAIHHNFSLSTLVPTY